ncbi:MAG: lipopolysaccharide biosynthesis protein [Verrucomicrobiales bacterium]|nr:lipopolysaccharide biosynthesis protein [Verrucomicrobiales bacterium]
MGSAFPAGLRLAGAFLQLLSTILITRTLGVEDSGMYFFWIAVMLEIGQVATFGLDRLALQQVPRIDQTEGRLIRFLAPLRASALALALVLSSALCAYALFVQVDADRSPFWYLIPFICVSGVVMSMINSETLAGLGRPVLAIVCRHTVLNLVLIISILSFGDRLTTDLALTAYAVAFFVSGFGAFLIPVFRGMGRPLSLPDAFQFREHLKQGSPLFIGSLFASLSFIVPLAVLERSHASEQIALVTTGFRLFVLIDVLVKAVHSLVMPEMSRAAHVVDGSLLGRIYRTAILKGLMVLGIPVLVLLTFAEPVMEIFGEGFGEGAIFLRVFMGFAFVSLLLGPTHQLLLMVGHTRRMAFYSFLHFLFTGTLSVLLVPPFGAVAFVYVIGFGIIMEKILLLKFSISSMRSRDVKGEGEQ